MGENEKIILINFLKALTRLLVQANLYKFDHPQVKEAATEALKYLNNYISNTKSNEISLTFEQNKLLINGIPFLSVEKLPNSLINLFKKLNIDTIIFNKNIEQKELTIFPQIINFKGKIEDFLSQNNIKNITFHKAIYTKIKSEKKNEQEINKTSSSIPQEIEAKDFEGSLKAIVSKLTENEEEQKKIINILFEKFKKEVEEKVQKAIEEIKREKIKAENDYIRTEAVISNIANGVLTVDKDGNIIMMNNEAQTITGKPLKEISGKKIFDITNIESQVLNLAEEIKSQNIKEINKNVKTKGNENILKTIKNSTAIVKNEEGKIVGTISIPTDIAKIKELEKLKEDFIANMTHELRSPLTSIKMALDLLSREKLDPNLNVMLNTAIRNSEKLNSIINDILDFSKLQSGKLTFKLEENDPYQIAFNAVESMKAWAKSKDIKLTLIKEENLPTIYADERRTEQILVNLLSNALKFTPNGGKIEVSIDRGKENLSGFVFFSVKDNGCGIKKEDQEKIFEKFVQASSGEKVGGTGLGLAITKAMTVMQGGTITVESEVGKGSTFRFSLPVFKKQIDSPQISEIKKEEEKPWWKKLLGI